MIELYNGDCRAFLSNYNGERFDAVITDPPYASGGATLSGTERQHVSEVHGDQESLSVPGFHG